MWPSRLDNISDWRPVGVGPLTVPLGHNASFYYNGATAEWIDERTSGSFTYQADGRYRYLHEPLVLVAG